MNERVKSKAELLKELKINQDDRKQSDEGQGFGTGAILFTAILFLGLGVGAGLYLPTWLDGDKASNYVSKDSASELNEDKTQPAESTPSYEETPTKVDSEVGQAAVLNGSGYVTARRMATVSAEMMGLITEVNVEEGMLVEEGQVLARLDDAAAKVNLRLTEARVDVLSAQFESAKASLLEAESNHSRVMKNQFSSEAEQTRVIAELSRQKANLAGIKANLSVAKLEVLRQQELLDDFTIRAPFAGVVTVKNAQPGEIVAPASAGGGFTRTGICTIVDMSSLEIEVDVNEAYIGRVSPGQKVIANLDAYPDWDIAATVIAIIPTADRAKATVKTRIGIDVNDPKILPDMGVKVAFLEQ